MTSIKKNPLPRRNFFKKITAGGIAAMVTPVILEGKPEKEKKPETNLKDALGYPRNEQSMPGKYPGQVVRVFHEKSVVENEPEPIAAEQMLLAGLTGLTGEKNISKAWRKIVSKKDRIGLKVNPVAGKTLTTSHAVVKAVIKQLKDAGIPEKNILIWDRREFQLHETGFTKENYPGIKITGTEQKDEKGSFYAEDGKLYGERMIDKAWYYWADVNGEYDEYTLPYMVNEGKYSYFSKICTQEVDKIINIPILKNAGSSITLCLKNLAFGSVSNTSRLHKELWAETCAEVCAFPPLRDKVVLNIVDGLKGCYNGGPAANPQFITNYKTLLVGTDPVAVDRIGYDIVLKKRIEKQIQKKDAPQGLTHIKLAGSLGLGEPDINKIQLKELILS